MKQHVFKRGVCAFGDRKKINLNKQQSVFFNTTQKIEKDNPRRLSVLLLALYF